jgi:hypothetical protein
VRRIADGTGADGTVEPDLEAADVHDI